MSLATGLIFGLIPALQSSKTDLTSTLKETGGRSGTGFRQNKTRSILVVTEVALALTLLVGSALLIRSAIALGRVDPGFDANNVLTMSDVGDGAAVRVGAGGGPDGPQRHRSPEGAARAWWRPARRAACRCRAATACRSSIVGRPLTDNGPYHGGGQWINITPGYFDVFKIPVKRGRAFTDRDDSVAPPVVIINEAHGQRSSSRTRIR